MPPRDEPLPLAHVVPPVRPICPTEDSLDLGCVRAAKEHQHDQGEQGHRSERQVSDRDAPGHRRLKAEQEHRKVDDQREPHKQPEPNDLAPKGVAPFHLSPVNNR